MGNKKFRKPFHIDPPLPPDEKDLGTKRQGIGKEWDMVDDLWTVEDADGCLISSHKTEAAAIIGLEKANTTLP